MRDIDLGDGCAVWRRAHGHTLMGSRDVGQIDIELFENLRSLGAPIDQFGDRPRRSVIRVNRLARDQRAPMRHVCVRHASSFQVQTTNYEVISLALAEVGDCRRRKLRQGFVDRPRHTPIALGAFLAIDRGAHNTSRDIA